MSASCEYDGAKNVQQRGAEGQEHGTRQTDAHLLAQRVLQVIHVCFPLLKDALELQTQGRTRMGDGARDRDNGWPKMRRRALGTGRMPQERNMQKLNVS